jgi:hypothetical protein
VPPDALKTPDGTFLKKGEIPSQLIFSDGDGALLADFHAGFTAEAFLSVHRVGFAVLKFVNFSGADIDTFAATDALVLIDSRSVSHSLFLLRY